MRIFKLKFFADKGAKFVDLNLGLRFGFGLRLTVQPSDLTGENDFVMYSSNGVGAVASFIQMK